MKNFLRGIYNNNKTKSDAFVQYCMGISLSVRPVDQQ